MEDTFLTEAQQRVLELRLRGLTQAEIARRLNTSRANVSILERRAKENIARAERTLKLFERLKAPVIVTVNQGDDILQLPKRIFEAADAAKIRVSFGTAEIIARVKQEAGDKIHGRSVTKAFEVALASNGELIIS
ncbi:MAG: Tfx family DNA-binding protein [Candidatus Hadarchaeum sp.]|uniref:Tfx family DNA-binding protein n=1 Tax=Candidatus Hadarchaeum sp. TaxID=2883567 RepID=UPI003D0A0E96